MKKITLVLAALLTSVFVSAQITAGFTNDFEDGTTQGWANGGTSPNPPTNIPTGGPGGADDNFLEKMSAGGTGAGSRWVAFNEDTDWLGDYTAAGITDISFDVKNAGNNDLNLRIGIEGASSEIVTTVPVVVPISQTDWTNVVIPISEADFTVTDGTDPVADVLADVIHIRIFSSETVKYTGDAIEATGHLDNITANNTIASIEDNFKMSVSYYPNPVINNLSVSSTSFVLDSYKIVDVLGKTVAARALGGNVGNIDMSQLNSGVYFVTVSSSNLQETFKVVKQ